MKNQRRWCSISPVVLTTAVASALIVLLSGCVSPSWPQWGGPHRDFCSDASTLSGSWPPDGPRRLWTRELGEGYSSIALKDGTLFTSYRTGDSEVVVALDAQSGETVWEYKYAAPMLEGMDTQFGAGPAATPLIVNGRVYTFGRTGILHCLDQRSGKSLWSHDLVEKFGAKTPEFGFASSPLVYENTLIAPVGGPGCGVMAFDLADGRVVWQRHDFENIYASPLPINLDGQDQIVVLVNTDVVGLDPRNGELIWTYPHVNQWKTNVCTPVWDGKDTLFVSTSGEGGARGLKLSRRGNATEVEEIWTNRKMGVGGHANAVRIGDYVYASVGSSSLLGAVNIHTGKIAWRSRGFTNATLIFGGGKLIVLDEDGHLALITPDPNELIVESKVQLLDKVSWSAPTLVGTRLYLRDKKSIMALELG